MDKTEFILRQISKTKRKKYENYAVTRIWHKLDNLNLKLVTQQHIKRPGGGRALTDMYFPQLALHIEIDENFHLEQIEADKVREQDIINVTNHEILRIDCNYGNDLNSINLQINNIVLEINKRIDKMEDKFVPWDIEKEQNPQTYINKGYIDVADDVAFNKEVDASNCFGHSYIALQRGGTKHPYEEDVLIWFPKLYPNGVWLNEISEDEETIKESHIEDAEARKHALYHINSRVHKRIVFAKVKGALGDIMYRFKGLYGLDVESSRENNYLIWRRISTRVKTYKPKKAN